MDLRQNVQEQKEKKSVNSQWQPTTRSKSHVAPAHNDAPHVKYCKFTEDFLVRHTKADLTSSFGFKVERVCVSCAWHQTRTSAWRQERKTRQRRGQLSFGNRTLENIRKNYSHKQWFPISVEIRLYVICRTADRISMTSQSILFAATSPSAGRGTL